MPQETPILKLVTENSNEDSQRKFLTHRMDLNGNTNSNMTKIDAWAGGVNTKLEVLNKITPDILLTCTKESMGYYTSTSSDIATYKVGLIVMLSLNENNDGNTTLKVNALDSKSLMKYGNIGQLIPLVAGDLRKGREYKFRYDGTCWVWQSATSSDQISTSGVAGNVLKISEDNTIVDSGTSLGLGELTTTNKTIIGGMNEIDADVGNKESLTTASKTDLVSAINEVNLDKVTKTYVDENKIDKTKIKNTLTETTTGNVLDASQGKALDDKIKVLSEDALQFKGDLNRVDIKTITESGIYRCIVCTNIPFSFGILTVKNTLGYIEYLATDIQTNKTYAMTRQDNGTFSDWNCPDDKITALKGKTYQELPVLRSGTALNYIISSSVRYGIFGVAPDTSIADAPDTHWGVCRFTRHASAIWSVEWFSDNYSNYYKRTIYIDNWQKDKWSTLATADKIDISPTLLNGFGIWGGVVGGAIFTKCNNVVFVSVRLAITPQTVVAPYTPICNIPTEFLPKSFIKIMCENSPGVFKSLTIEPTGKLVIGDSGLLQNGNWIIGDISYII